MNIFGRERTPSITQRNWGTHGARVRWTTLAAVSTAAAVASAAAESFGREFQAESAPHFAGSSDFLSNKIPIANTPHSAAVLDGGKTDVQQQSLPYSDTSASLPVAAAPPVASNSNDDLLNSASEGRLESSGLTNRPVVKEGNIDLSGESAEHEKQSEQHSALTSAVGKTEVDGFRSKVERTCDSPWESHCHGETTNETSGEYFVEKQPRIKKLAQLSSNEELARSNNLPRAKTVQKLLSTNQQLPAENLQQRPRSDQLPSSDQVSPAELQQVPPTHQMFLSDQLPLTENLPTIDNDVPSSGSYAKLASVQGKEPKVNNSQAIPEKQLELESGKTATESKLGFGFIPDTTGEADVSCGDSKNTWSNTYLKKTNGGCLPENAANSDEDNAEVKTPMTVSEYPIKIPLDRNRLTLGILKHLSEPVIEGGGAMNRAPFGGGPRPLQDYEYHILNALAKLIFEKENFGISNPSTAELPPIPASLMASGLGWHSSVEEPSAGTLSSVQQVANEVKTNAGLKPQSGQSPAASSSVETSSARSAAELVGESERSMGSVDPNESEQPTKSGRLIESELPKQSTGSQQLVESHRSEQSVASKQPMESSETDASDQSRQPMESSEPEESHQSKQPTGSQQLLESYRSEQSVASKQPMESNQPDESDQSKQPIGSEQNRESEGTGEKATVDQPVDRGYAVNIFTKLSDIHQLLMLWDLQGDEGLRRTLVDSGFISHPSAKKFVDGLEEVNRLAVRCLFAELTRDSEDVIAAPLVLSNWDQDARRRRQDDSGGIQRSGIFGYFLRVILNWIYGTDVIQEAIEAAKNKARAAERLRSLGLSPKDVSDKQLEQLLIEARSVNKPFQGVVFNPRDPNIHGKDPFALAAEVKETLPPLSDITT